MDEHSVDRALEFVLRNEGGISPRVSEETASSAHVLCSECFSHIGWRLHAELVGAQDSAACPSCGSAKGKQLDKRDVELIAYRFFVIGSIQRTTFGGAPLIQCNATHLVPHSHGCGLRPELACRGGIEAPEELKREIRPRVRPSW